VVFKKEDSNPYLWINELTLEQARQVLADRRLLLQRIVPVLHARLLQSTNRHFNADPWHLLLHLTVESVAMSLSSRVSLSKSTPQKDDWPLPVLLFALGEEKGEDAMGTTDDSRPYLRPRAFSPSIEQHSSRASTAKAYNLMRKWNLHFSGKRGSDAKAFLLRIKEARAIVPITDSDLFKYLPLFLSDMALYWVQLENENWRDWNDFETARRFGDPDYQYALCDEIFRQTQGEHESAVDHLMCLRTLLSRMSPPWPLAEQLNFVYWNKLPRLQIAIRRQEFADFSTFEYLVTRVERSYLAEKNYRPPLPPEQSIFPDLIPHFEGKNEESSYHRYHRFHQGGKVENEQTHECQSTRFRENCRSNSTLTASPSTTVTTTASALKCWNCETIGHCARECTEPCRIYCYWCDKREFTVKTCSTCAENADRSQ